MADGSSPFEAQGDGALQVTFKAGSGYDLPWFVIRAKSAGEMKIRIGTAFNIDGWEDMTVIELIAEATTLFHAIETIRGGMGGRVSAEAARARADSSDGDVWAEAAAAQAEAEAVDPDKQLIAEIDAAETTTELKKFWVKHNPLSEAVEAAWRAKGKFLTEKESK